MRYFDIFIRLLMPRSSRMLLGNATRELKGHEHWGGEVDWGRRGGEVCVCVCYACLRMHELST